MYENRKTFFNKFKNELYVKLNELNIKLLNSNYINSKYKHDWKCLKCNNEFKQTWNIIKQGYKCPKCYPRRKNQKEKFINELNKILNDLNLKLLDDGYVNSRYKHNWKCLNCNFEFKQIWNEIKQGYKCPKCYPRYEIRKKKSIDEFKELNLELLDNNYINSRYRHNWKCLKCGKEFRQLLYIIKSKIYKCPICYPRKKKYLNILINN